MTRLFIVVTSDANLYLQTREQASVRAQGQIDIYAWPWTRAFLEAAKAYSTKKLYAAGTMGQTVPSPQLQLLFSPAWFRPSAQPETGLA